MTFKPEHGNVPGGSITQVGDPARWTSAGLVFLWRWGRVRVGSGECRLKAESRDVLVLAATRRRVAEPRSSVDAGNAVVRECRGDHFIGANCCLR